MDLALTESQEMLRTTARSFSWPSLKTSAATVTVSPTQRLGA